MGEPRLLIESAESYRRGSEDRLTEVFATTLQVHPGFLAALSTRFGMPAAATVRTVETQFWCSDGKTRIDMRLEGHDAVGATTSVIYVENKIDGYWFSDGQVARERTCLDTEHSEHRALVCVVATSDREPLLTDASSTAWEADFDCPPISWRDVAEMADLAGREWPRPWGGPGWQQRALDPNVPAAQRLLFEFINYLAEDQMLEPLTKEDLETFRTADATVDAVEGFLERGAGASDFEPVLRGRNRDMIYVDESSAGIPLRCIDFVVPDGNWLKLPELTLTLALSSSDPSAAVQDGPSELHGGVYLPKGVAELARVDRRWMQTVALRGFEQFPYDEGLWLAVSRKLEGFLDGSSNQQSDALAGWIATTFNTVLDLPVLADLEPPDGRFGPRASEAPNNSPT